MCVLYKLCNYKIHVVPLCLQLVHFVVLISCKVVWFLLKAMTLQTTLYPLVEVVQHS